MPESVLKIKKDFTVKVPGDKSVSHRSVLFSALSSGRSKITNFLEAEDPLNTLKSFAKMGLTYRKTGPFEYELNSPGKHGLKESSDMLDFGNAGTGIRLSAGLLSGLQGIRSVLTGDESLRKRPMKRIIEPLTEMGADIRSEKNDDKAPLIVKGTPLKSFFHYKSILSSAQVKSCLMLGAIASDTELEYEEEELSRDHTENMLRFLGGKIVHSDRLHFKISPPYDFQGTHFKVPGDISSASFFIVLGLLAKSGSLVIEEVGLNPARTGIITVLKNMGADIKISNERSECGEIIGDIIVNPSRLKKTEITKELIPSIIDEIPILSIAGLFSEGGFSISNAEDLRAKESDRIHSMVLNLRKIGADVDEKKDGYSFGETKEIRSERIETFHDHRIAMSFMILSSLTGTELKIDDESWIDTSFPGFQRLLSDAKS